MQESSFNKQNRKQSPFSETPYEKHSTHSTSINQEQRDHELLAVTQYIPNYIFSLPYPKKQAYLKIINELDIEMRSLPTNNDDNNNLITMSYNIQKRIRSFFYRTYFLMNKAQQRTLHTTNNTHNNTTNTNELSHNTTHDYPINRLVFPPNDFISPDLKVKAWEFEFLYNLCSYSLNERFDEEKSGMTV